MASEPQGPVQPGGMKTNAIPGAAIGIGQALLSPLFGKLFSGGGPDYTQILALLSRYFGPQVLQQDTQRLYSMGLASPGFQNQLQGINLAGNQFTQNYAAGQARQGFTGSGVRSGVGQVGAAAAPTLSSLHRGQAYGDLWSNSQNNALQLLMGRLGAFGGGRLQPGMGSMDLTRALFGAGLSGLSDYYGNKGLSGAAQNQQLYQYQKPVQ